MRDLLSIESRIRREGPKTKTTAKRIGVAVRALRDLLFIGVKPMHIEWLFLPLKHRRCLCTSVAGFIESLLMLLYIMIISLDTSMSFGERTSAM